MPQMKEVDIIALQDVVNDFRRSDWILESAEDELCSDPSNVNTEKVDYLIELNRAELKRFITKFYEILGLPNPFNS